MKRVVLIVGRNDVAVNAALEIRKIKERLLLSGQRREDFAIRTLDAHGPGDLIAEIRRHQPWLIHFASHGTIRDSEAIAQLSDVDGIVKDLNLQHLRAFLLETGTPRVECIFFNMCYVGAWADQMLDCVDVVIGTTDAVEDQTAWYIADRFYEAIGNGADIRSAYTAAFHATKAEEYPGIEHFVIASTSSRPLPTPADHPRLESVSSSEHGRTATDVLIRVCGEFDIETVFDCLDVRPGEYLPLGRESIDGCHHHRYLLEGSGRKWTVIVSESRRRGGLWAVVELTRALDRWQPRYLISLGLAQLGSTSALQPGDVVIPDQILHQDARPLGAGPLRKMTDYFHPSRQLLDLARRITQGANAPVHICPVASSSVAGSRVKLLDRESAAIFVACEAGRARQPRVLLVRTLVQETVTSLSGHERCSRSSELAVALVRMLVDAAEDTAPVPISRLHFSPLEAAADGWSYAFEHPQLGALELSGCGEGVVELRWNSRLVVRRSAPQRWEVALEATADSPLLDTTAMLETGGGSRQVILRPPPDRRLGSGEHGYREVLQFEAVIGEDVS